MKYPFVSIILLGYNSEKDIKFTIGTRLNSNQIKDVDQLMEVNKEKLEILRQKLNMKV